jgi:hypothetical protein
MEGLKPNPLVGAVLGMVQDRQAGEVARLELLARLAGRLDQVVNQLAKQTELLEELVIRGRK